MEPTKVKEVTDKAKEHGYGLVMYSSDKSWCSFYNEESKLNLEVYVDTNKFVLNPLVGTIKITTSDCGSFMNDKNFKRIEREIKRIVSSLSLARSL